MKRFTGALILTLMVLSLCGVSAAQEAAKDPVAAEKQADTPVAAVQAEATSQGEKVVVKGAIDEIADDNSYLVVNGTKINAPSGFIEDYFLLKGDEVEVTVKKTDNGLEAVDSNFMFTDEDVDDSVGASSDAGQEKAEAVPAAEKPVTK